MLVDDLWTVTVNVGSFELAATGFTEPLPAVVLRPTTDPTKR